MCCIPDGRTRLRDAGLLSEKRIELLLAWRHTGFAVRGETHIGPTDRKALETVARYMLRCPVSLARLVWREGEVMVVYKGQPDEPGEEIDACELVARGKRKKAHAVLQAADEVEAREEMSPEPAARRRSWAELIRRVYEVDPLICPKCGGEMRVVAFITEAPVIERILDHLARRHRASRAPPPAPPAAA